VLALSFQGYELLHSINSQFNLDFDDSFQFAVALENNLRLVTQDPDFRKVENSVPILFI
jgi:predicted nucleic acid-binding protein